MGMDNITMLPEKYTKGNGQTIKKSLEYYLYFSWIKYFFLNNDVVSDNNDNQ
jgi:hypothetical protein